MAIIGLGFRAGFASRIQEMLVVVLLLLLLFLLLLLLLAGYGDRGVVISHEAVLEFPPRTVKQDEGLHQHLVVGLWRGCSGMSEYEGNVSAFVCAITA